MIITDPLRRRQHACSGGGGISSKPLVRGQCRMRQNRQLDRPLFFSSRALVRLLIPLVIE